MVQIEGVAWVWLASSSRR